MKNSLRGTFLTLLVAFSLFSMGLNIKVEYTTEITMDSALESKAASFGAWIIIGGDRWDHDKLEWIKYTCNETYEVLKSCGYSDDDIYYLFPDADWATECPYADAYSTRANIQNAIEVWAAGKVASTEALGIYMMDHGDVDVLPLPGTDLTAANLDSYIDNFEAAASTDRVVIVYDACHSGSFINDLSESNRIVVTSTSSALNAFGIPPFFWDGFWDTIKNCKSIGDAFEEGESRVEAAGYGATQTPWIDDNHDGTGHEVDGTGNLPNGGDGTDALSTKICTWIACFPFIIILKIPLRIYLPLDPKYIPIYALIQNQTPIQKVYARIIPPGWQPIVPQPDNESGFISDDGVYWEELIDPDGDGNYTGTAQGGTITPPPQFTRGDYKINIIVQGENGSSAMESTYWTVNPSGTPPPDSINPTVMVTNPSASSDVSGFVQITAEGDDDQGLAKIELYIDGELMNTTYMPDFYPYPEATYEWNTAVPIPGGTGENETHIILAKAYDKAGNTATHAISVNINPIPGFTITIVFFGCFLVVAVAYLLRTKEKSIP